MNVYTRRLMSLLSGLVLSATSLAEGNDKNNPNEAATNAYIYAYPLVTMDMTRRVMTNTSIPENNHAPMGQFYNATKYPDASFRDVTAPNADTLYSVAWLDLSKEPYVFHIPDEKGRYFLMPMLNAWTEVFASPGTRTTGSKALDLVITGPNWQGQIPEGLQEVKSLTDLVWIIGRTYSAGTPEDYAAVHAIQKEYTLVPLSSYGKSYTPPKGVVDSSINMEVSVRDQVHALNGEEYFKKFAELLKSNPPQADDKAMIEMLQAIGIVPGKNFDITKMDPKVASAINQAPKNALEKLAAYSKTVGRKVNGWDYSFQTGRYGSDYLQRAYVTMIGLGANLPQDAIYPYTTHDGAGNILSGKNKYVIHFNKDQTPPVKGFWSITMYNDEYFFVNNSLNRYTISPRNDLKYNEDGSLDIYIQNEQPEKGKESNWLPAPKDPFILMLRMYWPEKEVIDGSWTPPAVKKINK